MLTIHAVNHMTSLVVSETAVKDGGTRGDMWLKKFGEFLEMKAGGWKWDRTNQEWQVLFTQQFGNGKPCAQVMMAFKDGDYGYILHRAEYRPLFWMDKKVRAVGVNKRDMEMTVFHEKDNYREITSEIKRMAHGVKDDLDPKSRLEIYLNELNRQAVISFEKVSPDQITIRSGNATYDLLTALQDFGYKVIIRQAPESQRFFDISVPR